MADCDNLFKSFDETIQLEPAKKEKLREKRNKFRKLIKDYIYSKSQDYEVSFRGQGSYAMFTIILPNNGEYDIDDGIYLISENEAQVEPVTVHKWVKEAVESEAKEVIDKNTCVRVIVDDECHLDFPIYHKRINSNTYTPDDVPLLAHKTKGWIKSDPLEFKSWFNKSAKSNHQIRRLVKYMKAWSDNKPKEMPSGLIMTIMTKNSYCFDSRDDKSLYSTLQKIERKLKLSFSCYRPTTDDTEDLLEEYSKTKKEYFLTVLASFIESASQALNHSNQKEACKKWQKHLGDRFPCHLAKDEDESKTYSSPAIIRDNAKSA